jgi:hypothetical protein
MPRPPANLFEALLAHCRPQPAIPAVLVLLLTLMLAATATGASAAWVSWAVAAGLAASCALAVAAGFCSFFPPLAWLGLVGLTAGVFARLPTPGIARAAAATGAVAALGMLVVQAWRVKTARFIATVADAPPGED